MRHLSLITSVIELEELRGIERKLESSWEKSLVENRLSLITYVIELEELMGIEDKLRCP